ALLLLQAHPTVSGASSRAYHGVRLVRRLHLWVLGHCHAAPAFRPTTARSQCFTPACPPLFNGCRLYAAKDVPRRHSLSFAVARIHLSHDLAVAAPKGYTPSRFHSGCPCVRVRIGGCYYCPLRTLDGRSRRILDTFATTTGVPGFCAVADPWHW